MFDGVHLIVNQGCAHCLLNRDGLNMKQIIPCAYAKAKNDSQNNKPYDSIPIV